LTRPVQALVVDDSALVRQVLSAILAQGGMSVTTAADALIALEKIKRTRPDVVVLDVHMPKMDGITCLRRIMQTDPIPVVICSGVARRGTDLGMRALDEGAVDIVAKPSSGVKDFFTDSALMLVETVRGAAAARVRRRPAGGAASAPVPVPRPALPAIDTRPPRARPRPRPVAVLALGASTGGTEALRQILAALPADAPAVVIVQHMPEHFTAAFARRLDAESALEVKEAAVGDRLRPGLALVAPGNRHLLLRRQRTEVVVQLDEGPLVSRHRPSVDVLFRSVAETFGAGAIGVLLTGMGDDGAAGLLELRQAGAHTIAQDEASSVVFGMPREAIARGAVDEVVELQGIAERIVRIGGLRLARPNGGGWT
jgi:two-component system, chemotaxis family, protein-glutamate methylesterase/glutaminase